MTPTEKPLLSLAEKVLFGFLSFALILSVFVLSIGPSKRYRLPNGDVVECSNMVETSKGNFHLTGCRDDSEYYVQGTLEIVR